MGRLLGILIATLGGIGAGAAVAVALDDLRRRRVDKAEAWALFRARIGFAVTVSIVAYAVAEARFRVSTFDWKTWAYTLGLFLAAEGYVTALFIRRRKEKP